MQAAVSTGIPVAAAAPIHSFLSRGTAPDFMLHKSQAQVRFHYTNRTCFGYINISAPRVGASHARDINIKIPGSM